MMHIYEFYIRLSMIDGQKLSKIKKIQSNFSDNVDANALLNSLNFNQQQQQHFFNVNTKTVEQSLNWLKQPNHYLICYHNSHYPQLLKQISSAPIMLFAIGNIDLLSSSQIAMVGSRQFSEYGAHWARYFSSELAIKNITITSGLALGIDAICHRGALEVNGKTIAVLGSGLAKITPRLHLSLAQEIISNNGTIISEFLPFENARPEHFPRRNRIISGLSLGTFVVEASQKSGSLITARYALEQNRDIFALPGDINNDNYQGTHWLIQQGANLVTKPNDIFEYLNSSLHWIINQPNDDNKDNQLTFENQSDLQPEQNNIIAIINHIPTPVDIIAEKLELSVSEVMIKLLDLELSGVIRSVSGGYIRHHQG